MGKEGMGWERGAGEKRGNRHGRRSVEKMEEDAA